MCKGDKMREYQSSPTYQVESKYGVIELTPTSATHIHVSSGSGGYVKVRGLDLRGSVHASLIDGAWVPWRLNERGRQVDQSHVGRPDYKEPSEPQRRAIRDEFIRVVTEWAKTDEARRALQRAASIDLNNSIERVESKALTLREQLAVLDAELAGLLAIEEQSGGRDDV